MQMNKSILIAIIVGLVPLYLCSEQVFGQRDDRGNEHPNSRMDVDFPGGTVKEFIDAIRKARPKGAANVVVMPDAESLRVPPVNLVAVTVDAAVQILEGPYRLPNGRRAEVRVSSYNIDDSSDLVLKIMADFEERSIRSSVWSVEPALASGQTAEELLRAIEAVLSLFSQKAEISFHPPTQLLIARGAPEQLDLVNETLSQLVYNAERRREETTSIHNEMENLKEELGVTTGEIRVMDQTVALTKSRLERANQAREMGTVSPDVLAEAELEMTRAETQLQVVVERRERIQRRLKALRTSLKKWEQPKE